MASKWPTGPRKLYSDAVRYWKEPQWTAAELTSKRLRATIRLLALEERLQELGLGALPQHVVAAMRVLSDYQEMNNPKYYRKSKGPDGREMRARGKGRPRSHLGPGDTPDIL